ncbi:MAG TPA: ATP-grasp domain-containing protein [Epulopiscium sp.]|nr:ATP-grasp domain-containing protein [Candidatus Epulonipiscium sp.]
MIAIVTDVNFKMALAIIRDLGEKGINVIACQSDNRNGNSSVEPLGFRSKYVSQKKWLTNMEISEEKYIEDLLNVCEEASKTANERCVLIPVGAKTLGLLATPKTRERFSNVGLYIPNQEQLDLFNGKKEVAILAEQLGIPVPKSYEFNSTDSIDGFLSTIKLPCVVKPNCGEKLNLKAAERYCIVRDADTLKEKFNYFYGLEKEPPIVQEYVGGDGYGMSILAKDGVIVDSICHKRIREYPSAGGPSTCCISQKIDILEEYAKQMISNTKYTGIAMLEFKETEDGIFKILEINPRVWGTYPLTRVAKTKFTYNWFVLAHNSVNDKQLSLQHTASRKENRKMRYFFADLRAILSYQKNNQSKRAFKGILDLFNPGIRDGVVECKDIKASMYYIRLLFSRTNKKVD